MLPIILKIRLATMAMASFASAASPVPMPANGVATVVAARIAGPVEVPFYDENEHQAGTVAIWRDGATDAPTTKLIKRLFRSRRTLHQHRIAKKTLAMLADVSEHYQGKAIEYVSGFRDSRRESRTSPHRAGRAVDFRIRGVRLRTIRDYLWRTYRKVGVGWYPSEQFIHIDTRPHQQDCSWTFWRGVNHYHPYWAELARRSKAQRVATARRIRRRRRAGS